MKTPMILVGVAYAPTGKPMHWNLRLPSGSTVGDAIGACGVLVRCPEIDLDRNRVGIFGRLVRLDTPLRGGDRVEIYRPLNADPKEARRRRATSGNRRA